MPIRVDYKCDSCKKGYFRPSGETLYHAPPKYVHFCNYCSKLKSFTKKYPYIEYESSSQISKA